MKRVKFKSKATGKIKIMNERAAKRLEKRERGEIVDAPHPEELTHNGKTPFSQTEKGRALGRGTAKGGDEEPDEPKAKKPKTKEPEKVADDEEPEDADDEEPGADEPESSDTKGLPVPNFRKMSWGKLQKTAAEANVYQQGMSKIETIEALEKFHGVGDVAG